MKTTRTGRAISWAAFLLGILVSIAGNIGHATIGPYSLGELIGAGFWPTALLLSIEILTRVRWQSGKRWGWARFGGVGLVAAVAAVLSYLHLRSLLLHWGEGAFQSTIGPLAVDGLMLVSATALLSISKERASAPAPARAAAREDAPADKPSTPVDKPVDKPKKLAIVHDVPESAPEDHARDLWLKSGRTLSAQQVADILGTSKSTAHRRIQAWSA